MSPSTALAIVEKPQIIPVTARPHPLSMDTVYAEFQAGLSIAEILGPDARCCRVELGGMTIPEEWWIHIRPKAGIPLVIIRYPEGGSSAKSIFRIIAFAALAIGVVVTAGLGATAFMGFGLAFGMSGATTAALCAAGIGLVGSLIINALIPPPGANIPSLGAASTNLLRSITGTSNQVNLYGAVPFTVGVMLVYPTLAALPMTELSGDDQYLRMLFDLGSGDPAVSDMKIGNTDLASYTDVETELGTNPGLFSQDIAEVAAGDEMDTDGNTATRTSGTAADELSIDLQHAQGLFGVDASGNTITVTCKEQVEYRLTGTSGAWSSATTATGLTISSPCASANGDGTFHVVNGERKAVRIGLRWKVTTGQYDIRVTRVSTDWGTSDPSAEVGALTWTVIRTIRYAAVSTTGTLKLALRIKATDQLSGSISQFNVILAQPIPVWHPLTSSWVTEVSTNPAFIFRWLLKDCPGNPRRVDISRIDDDELKDWALECADKAFCYSNCVDQFTTLFVLLKDVCAAGRASFTVRESKYSVVRDIAQTTPIQVFTPRNSWGFSGSRAFPDAVHALRVHFINPDAAYQQDEVIVYDDGFGDAAMLIADPSLTLATLFEQLTVPGCTDADAAWRLGRYHLAVGRLRPNTYFWNADIENLVCNRGDLIYVANDVIGVGLSWGRITGVTTDGSSNVTDFACDEQLSAETGITYAVRVRCDDGTVVLSQATLPRLGDGIQSVTLVTPSPAIKVGDLFVFGVLGQDTIPMIIGKIESGQDLSAKITAVDAAPAVLTADTGTPPAFTSQITGQPWVEAPPAPDLLVIGSDQLFGYPNDAGNTTAAMNIIVSGAWSGTATVAGTSALPPVDHIDVRVRLASTVGAWTTYTLPFGQNTILIDGLIRGVDYQVEARTVSAAGGTSAWIQQTHSVANATILPLVPAGLSALSVADGVALQWHVSGAQRGDVEYEVQRTGDISGAPDGSSWADITTVKALTYTDGVTDRVVRWYRVRAIDFQGLATAWCTPQSSKNKAVDDGAAVGALSSGITYTSDDTTVTVSWVIDGYLTDLGNTPFGGSGSQTLTGLTASTTYHAYPYWDIKLGVFACVLTGGVGTPSWAHTTTDRAWAAEQLTQGHIALTSNPFTTATVASGFTGGGSGGGDGGCLRYDVLVEERDRGFIRAIEVRKGDWLKSREGYLQVQNDPLPKAHDTWIHLSTTNGVNGLPVTAGHPFEDAETGKSVRAYDLTLQTKLRCPEGITSPTELRIVREHGFKVPIMLSAPHVFFASVDGLAWVETHNLLMYNTV